MTSGKQVKILSRNIHMRNNNIFFLLRLHEFTANASDSNPHHPNQLPSAASA